MNIFKLLKEISRKLHFDASSKQAGSIEVLAAIGQGSPKWWYMEGQGQEKMWWTLRLLSNKIALFGLPLCHC